MSKSWKRKQREKLGKDKPLTTSEFTILTVLADVINAIPQSKRTDAMKTLLTEVKDVQTEHPSSNK